MKNFDRSLFDPQSLAPQVHARLMKIHKHATAGFNVKQMTEILAVFPGWKVETKVPMLKLSDTGRQFSDETAVFVREQRRYLLLRTLDKTLRQEVHAYEQDVALAVYEKMRQYLVAKLPDPKTVKADHWVVMNLSPLDDSQKRNGMTAYTWTLDLYRRVNGTRVTAPDGQSFDICGPVQSLGYGGIKTCGDFFTWALAHTDLEPSVNAVLGLTRHVPASERPRKPKVGQTIGTCGVCESHQVVHGTKMVFHGYQRPGYGHTIGECPGVKLDAYEVSTEGCEHYLKLLGLWKTDEKAYLVRLNGNKKALEFSQTRDVPNTRPRQRETILVTLASDAKLFEELRQGAITATERKIADLDREIERFTKKITDWKPGTLRTNTGLGVR